MPSKRIATMQILLLFTLLFVTTASAKNVKIDSLEKVLQHHTAIDTAKVNMLTNLAAIENVTKELGDIYLSMNSPVALSYFQEALTLTHKLNSKPTYGEVWIKMGILHSMQKQYDRRRRTKCYSVADHGVQT